MKKNNKTAKQDLQPVSTSKASNKSLLKNVVSDDGKQHASPAQYGKSSAVALAAGKPDLSVLRGERRIIR
ncbi:MAG TPA: hypothetical protein PKM63_19495 [Panacibacter sp.]|nr:hypothetical protein [Panacibacter sp.]HNP46489.1 hypothetical protein [Panacibacter sp.]